MAPAELAVRKIYKMTQDAVNYFLSFAIAVVACRVSHVWDNRPYY